MFDPGHLHFPENSGFGPQGFDDYCAVLENTPKDPDALYGMARCYLDGEGVPQSDESYVEWMLDAVREGHPTAPFELGYYFYQHDEYDRAIPLLAEVAPRFMGCYTLLGDCYVLGEQQDYRKAVEYYALDAELGTDHTESGDDARAALQELSLRADEFGIDEGAQEILLRAVRAINDPESAADLKAILQNGLLSQSHGDRFDSALSFLPVSDRVGGIFHFTRLGHKYRDGTDVQAPNPLYAARCYVFAGATADNIIRKDDPRHEARNALLALWEGVKGSKLVTRNSIEDLVRPLLEDTSSVTSFGDLEARRRQKAAVDSVEAGGVDGVSTPVSVKSVPKEEPVAHDIRAGAKVLPFVRPPGRGPAGSN